MDWAFGDFANDGFGSLSNTFIFFVSPPELMRIWHPFSAAYSSGDQTIEVTPTTFNKISDFQNIIELFLVLVNWHGLCFYMLRARSKDVLIYTQ